MFPSPSPTPSACGWRPTAGRTGARPWPRAATCRVQAVLVLGWMVAGTALTTLARDSRVSRATAYRYPLRGPGRDRRPGPGPSRGPSAVARAERAERRPGWDLDPHRPGGPGATRTRAATCGIQVLAGAFGGNVQVVMDFRRVPRVYGSGGARLHPRPDRGQAACATGPVPVRLVGDQGLGKVGGWWSDVRGCRRVGAGAARPRRDDGWCLNQPRRRGVAPPCHHPPQPPCRASP